MGGLAVRSVITSAGRTTWPWAARAGAGRMAAVSASVQPDLPRRIGDFAVLGVLGEGGSGIVYDARWGHREVALKVLHPALVATAKEREQFLGEARLLAELQHPGVVKVLGVGEGADGRPYLAMEKLRGESLAARLARGPLPLGTALELFGQLADAVTALHARGLVHRDLKPENVVLVRGVDGRDHAVLLDFGIAKDLAAPASTTTQDGGVRGTPAYMAPERFFGQPASIATDVYELAVVLYAMVAGRLPWDDCADPDVRLNPRGLAETAPAAPPALDVVVRRALSTRAPNRPATALELREAVMVAAGAHAPVARTTDAVRPAPRPTPADVYGATVAMRGPAAPGGPGALEHVTPAAGGYLVPATTGAEPRRTGKMVAITFAAATAVIGVGVAAKLLSDPGDGIPAPASASVAPAPAAPATAAPLPAVAAGTAAEVAPRALLAEPAPPPAVAASVDLGQARAAMAAAVEHLPDDTMFAFGVLLAELRADDQLDGLIDAAIASPSAQVLILQADLGACSLDLRGKLDWLVMGGPAEDSAVDLIASGQWTRAELEDCLRVAVDGTGVTTDGAISRIEGPKPRSIGWLDERTFYVSSRQDAGAEWLAARIADRGAPGGALGTLLPDVDLQSTLWLAGDERGRKVGLGTDEMTGLWGSARTGSSSIAASIRIRYRTAKLAEAAHKELSAQAADLDLGALGTFSITREKAPEVLRVEVSMPRVIVGMIVDGLASGSLTAP